MRFLELLRRFNDCVKLFFGFGSKEGYELDLQDPNIIGLLFKVYGIPLLIRYCRYAVLGLVKELVNNALS